MKTVNILHVASFYTMGGIENILGDFLRKPAKGFKFHVFSPYPVLKYWAQQFHKRQIPFYQAGFRYRWDKEIVQVALRCQADLVHFHWGIAQARALKENGVKGIIAHDHGLAWQYKSSAVDFIFNEYQYVDRIVSVSEASRFMLNQRLKIDLNKIVTIYNGINFKRIKPVNPIPSPDGKKVVLAIGRLEPQKGFDSLLKAAPSIIRNKEGKVKFWIVGDGSLQKDLIALTKQLGITKFVKFWGARKEIGNFLASAEILILPSIWEPFGNVLAEAGYFKKPCIATNVDGIPEIIIDHETGILIDPVVPVTPNKHIPLFVLSGRTKTLQPPLSVAPNSLAETILQLLNNPELCHSMGEKARQRVVQLFNYESYRDKLMVIYRELRNSLTRLST